MTLFIGLLGPAEFRLDETPLALKGFKPIALLAYLLLTGKAQTREHLVDLLYEDADDPRASLRWTLNQLRQGIGAEYLEADRQQIGFNFKSDYWLDVEAFSSGQTGLYRGEFLEGLYLRDASRFMDWAFFERERLRKAYQEALANQLIESTRRGDYQAVLETGHHLLRSDNLREEGHRALMQAYAHLGQREAALAQYEICRRLLSQELGVEPDEETIALYKQIQTVALAGPRNLANLPVQLSTFEEVTVPSNSLKRDEIPTQAMATPLESNQRVQQKVTTFFIGNRTEQQAQRNRQAMLKLVHDFWVKGVLENSLYETVRLELGLKTQAGAVEQPWEMIIQTPQVSSPFLPPGTRVNEVFSAMGEALLILGEPGSGKTTMLLELAREKIAQAENNPTQPLPVVFNLSSWQPSAAKGVKPGSSFKAWLIAELNSKYYLPEKIARPWVENDELLLLLDGLDEVAPERRGACVQAINDFRQEHLAPIVVCSRLADYELLTTKLKLHGAVLIQPLGPQQVEAYLAEAGPELAAVREVLQHDEPLQELAQSPLLLSTMTLAYRGLSVAELPALDSVEARRRHLFETYTRRMFERRGVDERYSPAETIHWLAQIAQKMSAHSQSVLMIERLQPTWLSGKSSRWLYTTGYGAFTWLIAALLIGLNWTAVVGLLHWLGGGGSTDIWNSLIFGLRAGFWLGLAVLVGVALWVRSGGKSRIESINPIEALRWSWSGLRNSWKSPRQDPEKDLAQLRLYLAFGVLIAGSLVGYAMNPQGWWLFTLSAGIAAALFLLSAGLNAVEIEMKVVPNQGIWQSARNAIFIAVIAGLGFGLSLVPFAVAFGIAMVSEYGRWLGWVTGLLIFLAFGGAYGGLAAVIGGLWYGGLAVIQHFVLRFILYCRGDIPWNLTHFLDYAAERIFLRKVGGGYIFIHRLLLEYFAGLEKEKSNN